MRVLAREEDLWRVQLPAPALEFFEQHGDVPLPPYIQRAPGLVDRERYQSIFAQHPGAVAAPTASLHFDDELVAALDARDVKRTFVTLHVGAGTFQPVRVYDLGLHHMHAERVVVSAATCDAIAQTRAAGKRVVAVGTTVARALESAALAPESRDAGQGSASEQATGTRGSRKEHGPRPYSGETTLFIRPGFRFKAVDALLTNFHLPESTLLMLVCAFAGRDAVLDAYAHAVRERYRFFSYGDAMFVTPARNAT